MVVIAYAKKNSLDWLNDKNTFNLSWTLIILIWDSEKNYYTLTVRIILAYIKN